MLIVSNNSYCYASNRNGKFEKELDNFNFNINGTLIVLRLNNIDKVDFKKLYDIMLFEIQDFVYKNNLLNLD